MHAAGLLLGLVLIGIVLLGGVALIVALLTHRHTRTLGAVLLVCGGVVVVLGGLSMFVLVARRQAVERKTLVVAPPGVQVKVEQSKHEPGPSAEHKPRVSPARRPASKAAASVKPTAAAPKPEPTEKASGVLPALGSSLAKAASETGVARASRSVQETPSVLAASLRALFKAVAKEHKSPGSGNPKVPKPPAWVDAEPGTVDGAFQVTAKVTGLTPEECDEVQPDELQKAAAVYVEHELGRPAAKRIRFSPEFLREHAVTDVWEETKTVDYGGDTGRKRTVYRHVLLRFGPSAKAELDRLSRAATIRRRLALAGFGLAALLAALGLAFAYLKINLATGGRYRGRLRAAAIAVILATIAANVLILTS